MLVNASGAGFPRRWGPKSELEVGGKPGQPITVVEVERAVPRDAADPDRAGASTNGQRVV